MPRRRLVAAVLWLCACLSAAWLVVRFVPVPEAVLTSPPGSVEFTDRHGSTLRETRVEDRFRRDAAYAEIPSVLVKAILAAEDKRFFSHPGVDWRSTLRALASLVLPKQKITGASTLTQQLVKISVPRPRTLRTKFVEIVTALRLEQCWSKEDILAAYLNRVEFGNLNFGVVQAAHYYFGKPLADLSLAEAALLAGLPWNPTRLNPRLHAEAAKRRQQTVLRRMLEAGWIGGVDFDRALAEPLNYRSAGRAFHAPHFVDLLLAQMRSARVSGSVRTTLDLDLHRFVEQSVSRHLAGLRVHNVQSAAAVVLENSSGEVLALVGSEDYFAPGSGMVNGAMQARSAGSTLKPVTYLLALERGDTPATIAADVPTEFSTSSGPYRPENFHRHCQGPVRYREALASSLNIPAVRVLQSLGGAAALQARLQAWGISTLRKTPEFYGLGLTLGNAEVRLLELANVYATLARMGRWQPCRLASGGAPGVLAAVPPSLGASAVVPGQDLLCWLIADILADNAARAPAFGSDSPLRFDFPVACKTGTSTDFRDNWALGYTPEFTVGVWVGNFDGTPMREVSGITGAGPILHEVFEHLHRRFGTSWFPKPPEITEVPVHKLSGKAVPPDTAGAVLEKFCAWNPPAVQQRGDVDEQGRVRLGREYASWFDGPDNQLQERVIVDGAGGLQLVSPRPGTVYVLDPDVPSSGLLPLVARGGERLVWESATLAVEERGGRCFAVAREGRHAITVRDARTGQTIGTWVVVKGL